MRKPLIAAAALIVMSAVPAPTFAVPVGDASAGLRAMAGSNGSLDLPIQKAKKKKKKSSSESATLNDIGSVKRGKQDVTMTATVAKAGRTCELKIEYDGGDEDSPEDVTADANKVCTFTIDISDDRDAVGEAKAKLTVRDGKGKKVASDSRTFIVK